MKYLFSFILWAVFSAPSAFAQDDSPDVLIKKVTEEVLTIVRQDKEIQAGNARKAIELVEAKVLPHFNFQRMTALSMGREWNKANPEQKIRLTEEFKTLLVRTYSNALTGYRDQTIRYKPTRIPEGGGDVVVRTEILQPGSKPIQLDYALEKKQDGWKVHDVIVAGVSLVTNYRDTFTQEVRANGVDGLIQMLATKNKQLESGKKMIDKLDNRYRVTGRMLIADARSLLEAGRALLLGGSDKDVLLDLAAVEDADSSALGVIFGLIRTAAARGVRIRLVNLPAGLVSLASLYGVSESLPLA